MEGVVGCGGRDGMRRCGPGEWRGWAGVDDGGAAETIDDGGRRGQAGLSDGGEIEDEQNRHSIYIGRDPLVPAGNTSRD